MKKGIVGILSWGTGVVTGLLSMNKLMGKQVVEKQKKIDKFKDYYELLDEWLRLRQDGVSLSQYFIDNKIKTISIYGMGRLGNRLYDELKNSDIEIKQIIDENANYACSEVQVVSVNAVFEEVDAIVVTAVFAFDEIVDVLSEKCTCDIISLYDIVYKIF